MTTHIRHGSGVSAKFMRRRLIVVAIAMLVVCAGATTAAGAVARVGTSQILPGTVVAGVDVGGMRASRARGVLQTRLDSLLRHRLIIKAGGEALRVVPARLGVRADVGTAVQQALGQSQATPWFSRTYHRLFGGSLDDAVPLRYSFPTAKIEALIAHLAATLDRVPQDAALRATANDTSISFVAAHAGRSLDRSEALSLVLRALQSHATSVRLPMHTLQPSVGNAQLGKTITVDLSTNTLRLYDGATVMRGYAVSTAIKPYSTPIGTWRVVGKDLHPLWINPGTAWAKSMPQTIPPGPANPLGLRALPLNASGILIHGTPEDSSIGHWASHGCIRMHEADVLALYPLVPVGTKVIVYGAPPWGASTVAGSSTGF